MQKNFLLFNSLRDKRPGREPLAYICDFSRYEKSSSMKRPTLKVIDFDSVVQNTKSSKSIILMSAFSNILLQSRSKVWMRAHKRTFKPSRLKSQICLIGGNGFVCSVSNELNSNYPNATSSVSISVNPKENNIVPILLCFPADISGISSSTTT